MSLADEAYSDPAPIVAAMRAEGLSLRVIADWLNAYRGPHAIATFPDGLSEPLHALVGVRTPMIQGTT